MRTSPADDSGQLARSLGIGAQRPPMQNRSGRTQKVSPPSIVPGASIRPRVRYARCRRPCLDGRRLGRPVRLAGPEWDRATVGHQQRVEGVHEVRRRELGLEQVHARAEPRQGLEERVVLAPREVEVDRVEEAVRRIVEAAPKASPGRLTRTSSSGEVMLWAPNRRSVVIIDRG
jgi:hypothetical protein